MGNSIPAGLTISADKQFLFFQQKASLSGITTNHFGDNSFQDAEQEQMQSNCLREIFQANFYQKLRVKHGDDVIFLDAKKVKQDNYHEADALVYIPSKIEREAILISNTADCPIVTLTDLDQNFIAIIHSGRPSTNLNIVGKTINLIQDRLENVYPGRILACLWPGIEGSIYYISEKDPHVSNIKPWLSNNCLDLRSAILSQLRVAGVLHTHINAPKLYSTSTIEDIEFFSYRIKRDIARNSIFITTTIQ